MIVGILIRKSAFRLSQKYDFRKKIRFSKKNPLLIWQKERFFPNCRFLAAISILGQNFDFWPELRFLARISIFDQHFDFWPEFRFLARISIFGNNFNFFLGACMLIKPFKPAARPLLRDMIFYLWSVYWMLQCLYKGKVELFDSIGFLVFYCIYVIIVALGSRFAPKKRAEMYPELEPVSEAVFEKELGCSVEQNQ